MAACYSFKRWLKGLARINDHMRRIDIGNFPHKHLLAVGQTLDPSIWPKLATCKHVVYMFNSLATSLNEVDCMSCLLAARDFWYEEMLRGGIKGQKPQLTTVRLMMLFEPSRIEPKKLNEKLSSKPSSKKNGSASSL